MASLIYFVVKVAGFVIFLKFRLFNWACFFFSLIFAAHCLGVALILMYVNPALQKGLPATGMPWIGLVMAAVFAAVAVLSLLPPRKNPIALRERSQAYEWILLIAGWSVAAFGGYLFLVAIYSAPTVGRSVAATDVGLWSLVISMPLGSVLLYLASRKNSVAAPNRMRWCALGMLVFSVGMQPVVYALILIYALPGFPPFSRTLEASLAMLTLLPVAALIWGMARDRKVVRRR